MQFLVSIDPFNVQCVRRLSITQLELSSPPAPSTLAHAEIVLTMEKAASEEPPELTWKRIKEEEPLEGEHWQEIGISNRSRSTPSSGSESDRDDIQSRSEDSAASTVCLDCLARVIPQSPKYSNTTLPTNQ